MKDFITKVGGTEAVRRHDKGVFVNLLIDGTFKLIMSKPANRDILKALLNEFLPFQIKNLSLAMQEKQRLVASWREKC